MNPLQTIKQNLELLKFADRGLPKCEDFHVYELLCRIHQKGFFFISIYFFYQIPIKN